MDFTLNMPSVVMLISGAILLIIVFYTAKNTTESAFYFKRMMSAAFFWAVANGIELASNDFDLKILISKISYIGVSSVVPFWLMFVSTYSKEKRYQKKGFRLLIFGIPIILLILVFTNEYHKMIWPTLTPYEIDGGMRVIYGHGLALYIFAVYSYCVIFMGTRDLIKTLRRSPSLIKRQILLILIGSLCPWISSIIYFLDLSPIPGVDLAPIGFIVMGVIFHYAIIKYRMLDLMPVARHTLFDELIDGVLVIDSKNRVTDMNSAATDLLDIDEENIIGKPLNEVLPSLYGLIDRISDHSKIRNGCFDHSDRTIDAKISSLKEKENACGYLVVLRDITDMRKAQEELLKAKEDAEAANAAKGRFLANVSHEIRTPMNGIMGFLELLSQTGLDSEQSEYLRNIKSASDTLLFLINDLLDYSRIEADKLLLENIPFNLHQVIEDSASLFVPAASEKDTEVNTCIAENVPAFVYGDPVRLRQVLNNIIGNAVKFTEKGQVTVDVSNVKEEEKKVLLKFIISDTGIGMSKDVIGKLFNVFTQADASTTRKYGGTGLGLAITKRIVDMCGGSITIESEPGRGSRFVITLKLEKADNADSLMDTSSPKNVLELAAPALEDLCGTQENSNIACILLVEDIAANRKLASVLLKKLGYRVEFAENGIKAVEMCTAKRYDLVLMDCQMPEMDGYQASRTIKTGNGDNSGTPIIAMTANAHASDKEKCLAAGMDDYITKPIRLQILKECLSEHLK